MTNQYNDYIYKLLGDLGFLQKSINDRWMAYLESYGVTGSFNDCLYTLLGTFGYTGSLNDRWKKLVEDQGGEFQGFASLYLDFTKETLDPRITFSRTSNATITKSDGTIGYAPHNLLTHSEQFDNAAWVKNSATVIANNDVAPNGTTTADKVTVDGSTINQGVYVAAASVIGITYTFSVYLKGVVGGEEVQIGDASSRKTVTLTTSWVRYTTDAHTWLSTNNIIYAKNNTAMSFYVWGAQLEIGSTATTYNPTTVKNLLGYTEAFDNAAWTKSNSFVQTNLLTYSEAFDNAAWSKVTSTVTANSVIAPNGYQTADTFIPNTASSGNIVSANVTITTATTVTASIYFKAAGLDQFTYWYGGLSADRTGVTVTVATNAIANYTIGTGANPSASSITPVGNDWYRLVFTTVTPNANNAIGLRYLGSTTANGTNGLYIWGAQLVQGSVAGDYRRTDAAALPVFYANHNGVVCAEKLVVGATVGQHYMTRSAITGLTAGANQTISIYAKAGERDWLLMYVGGGGSGTATAYFNLATGALGAVSGGITSANCSIIASGNGYYRCSITTSPTSTTLTPEFHPVAANNGISNTGDGTSGIYIFGAQLSDSASLDPYVLNAAAAPTAQAYYGARFDYDPVTLAPKGLLIEEQRSNLLLNSLFAGAVAGTPGTAPTSWSVAATGGSITSVTLNAGEIGNTLTLSASAARQIYQQSFSLNASTTYQAEIYLVSNPDNLTLNQILSWVNLPVGSTAAYFINGIAATQGDIPTANSFLSHQLNVTTAGTGVLFRFGAGCQSNVTGTVAITRPQLEAGAFATSYIPTAASAVTRAADNAEIRGSNFYSWFNVNEGSIYTNINPNGIVSVTRPATQFNDGSTNNTIQNYIFNNFFGTSVRSNASNQADINLDAYASNTNYKIASGYALNNVNGSRNGSIGTTDTSVILPNVIDRLYIGSTAANSVINENHDNFISGTIQSISYYNTRLPNSTLQSLTS
jgi:hypothetical protein